MLFGDEFAKQATTKVAAAVEPRAAVQDTSSIRGGQPDKPVQTEQSRIKDLELVENCVNCHKEIIICHHTFNLSVVLPSIKRGIVTSLHAG